MRRISTCTSLFSWVLKHLPLFVQLFILVWNVDALFSTQLLCANNVRNASFFWFIKKKKKQWDSNSYSSSSTFTQSHWPKGLGKVNIVHFTLHTQVAPGTEPCLAQTQDVQVFNGIVFQFRQHVFTVVEDVGIKSSLHISSLPGPSSKLVLVSLVLVSRYLFFLQVAQLLLAVTVPVTYDEQFRLICIYCSGTLLCVLP